MSISSLCKSSDLFDITHRLPFFPCALILRGVKNGPGYQRAPEPSVVPPRTRHVPGRASGWSGNVVSIASPPQGKGSSLNARAPPKRREVIRRPITLIRGRMGCAGPGWQDFKHGPASGVGVQGRTVPGHGPALGPYGPMTITGMLRLRFLFVRRRRRCAGRARRGCHRLSVIHDGPELLSKIWLAAVTGEIDRPTTIQHIEPLQ